MQLFDHQDLHEFETHEKFSYFLKESASMGRHYLNEFPTHFPCKMIVDHNVIVCDNNMVKPLYRISNVFLKMAD